MVYVVSGPSGCGKSTLIGRALQELTGLQFSVSYTTRPRRKSEKDGRDYHFVDEKVFREMIRARKFLEWACVHGNLYGTSREEVRAKSRKGIGLVLDIDVQGAEKILKSAVKAVFVFVMPPDYGELRRRLLARGENTPEDVDRRMQNARREIRSYLKFDFVVINDDRDEAARRLEAIILAAQCRRESLGDTLTPVLRSFSVKESR